MNYLMAFPDGICFHSETDMIYLFDAKPFIVPRGNKICVYSQFHFIISHSESQASSLP